MTYDTNLGDTNLGDTNLGDTKSADARSADAPTPSVVNFTDERLVRRMPDHPLGLDEPDEAYLGACLAKIDIAFDLGSLERATPDMPLRHIPGRALMRRLTQLRATLIPRTAEQRAAHGMLWGAIGLLNTARALNADRLAAHPDSHGGGNSGGGSRGDRQ